MFLKIYSLLWWCIAPLLRLKLYLRARKEPLYGLAISERYGRYTGKNADGVRPIWIHAVSLGETRAVVPLVQQILAAGYPVLLTHMTATGREEGQKTFAKAIEAKQLQQVWLPYDTVSAVKRFFRFFQPRCGLLVETEVWPNLLTYARAAQIPISLVNARLSPRSFARLQRFQKLTLPIYQLLSQVLTQTPIDQTRFQTFLGNRVPITLTGNMKFDGAVQTTLQTQGHLFRQHQDRAVIAIASTREGEEELFIAALQTLKQQALFQKFPLWILIPRHPQRFDEVAATLELSPLNFVRRSSLSLAEPLPSYDVLLGDSIGEMGLYYSMVDFAIIGGGFLPFGGQNHIEAAHYGTPVCVGPHTSNFKQAVEDAVTIGAACQVATVDEALQLVHRLLEQNQEQLKQMQLATHSFIQQHGGAVQKTYQTLQPYFTKE